MHIGLLVCCLITLLCQVVLDADAWKKYAKALTAVTVLVHYTEVASYGYGSCYALVHRLEILVQVLLVLGILFWAKPAASDLTASPMFEQTTVNYVMQPMIFPCRTSHTRIFPKKHSFSYSYLLVGVPVGWRGCKSNMLSSEEETLWTSSWFSTKGQRGAWFTIHASDHLDRGSADVGLRGKLDAYLKSQDVSPKKYPFAYLVTAPRFLEYSFNPVSFWYLYSTENRLTAMILEVNNTFDERRMYLLEDKFSPEISCETESPQSGKNDALQPPRLANGTIKFARTWAKDFHVSPFNSRKGSYSLVASNLLSELSASKPINNTITLGSSKGHAKIVARVFSTESAINPEDMTGWAKIRFILSWWWMGFVTYPRIVREAGKIFFRRKLHVWFRPEVLKDSIGRRENDREKVIEDCFRKFLCVQVEQSTFDAPVEYISAGTNCQRNAIFYSHVPILPKPNPPTPSPINLIQFKVLTPLFYSRLIRYAHLPEFISTDIFQQDDENHTFYTSNPDTLLRLFANPQDKKPNDHGTMPRRSWLDDLQWFIIQHLRRSPPKYHQGAHQQTLTERADIRLSILDTFVRHHCSKSQAREYREAVIALLVSDHIAFGIPELVDVFGFIARVTSCCGFVQMVSSWC